MKGIITNFILISIVAKSYCCKQEWDSTCKTDKDCCSKRCFREPAWVNGFCIAGNVEPPKFEKCAEDNFEGCIVNEHCCSKLCNRSPYDQFGRCTPKAAVLPVPVGDTIAATCENDGFPKCVENYQCCSGICEKKGKQKTGVCKSSATQQPHVPQCLADGSNQCSKNEDCCSQLCSKNPNPQIRFGICRKNTALPQGQQQPQQPRQCQRDLQECTVNNQCCSGICEKKKRQRNGTCKPTSTPGPASVPNPALNPGIGPTQVPSSYPYPQPPTRQCQKDWYNKCTSHNNCCSGYCNMEGHWQYGVCTPTNAPAPPPGQVPIQTPGSYPPNQPCERDHSNQCTEHSQCCSGYCKTEGNWKYGVCEPNQPPALTQGQAPAQGPGSYPASGQPSAQYPTPHPPNQRCKKDYSNQCTDHSQCCSGYCKTEGNWKYGVCEPNQPPALTQGQAPDQGPGTYPALGQPSAQLPGTYPASGQPPVQASGIYPAQGQVPAQYPEPYPKKPCELDNFNKCTEHNQCCSGYCHTEGVWKFGTCKPLSEKPPEAPRGKKCDADWTQRCVNDQDCCSGYCEANQNHRMCKPYPTNNAPEINYRNIQYGNRNGGIKNTPAKH